MFDFDSLQLKSNGNVAALFLLFLNFLIHIIFLFGETLINNNSSMAPQ